MLENKRPFVLRTVQYSYRCLKTTDLCVENNTIFAQMLKPKDPCVKNNTLLTQMLNTKDPLYRQQYNIYIDA